MAVRLDKSWTALTADNLKSVAAHLGVYQLANAAEEIVYIGVADARTTLGLKGELTRWLEAPPSGAAKFRIEINMSYRTRHAELLAVFQHDYGRLPEANTDVDPASLGRLRPGGGPG